MLRWRRFCEHTSAIEKLYPDYKRKLEKLDVEYKDAKEKAHRLSNAYDTIITENNKEIAK